jgi:ribonuclease PH
VTARSYDRAPGALRPTALQIGFVPSATGSALITQGETRVICTASVDESVPRWMEGRGSGWVTAEYGMLPASTGQRKQRDVSKGRPDGRTVEIQRLIGRSLRQAIDMAKLGERTVWIDCDVLTADGGTRCAAITGGYVALAVALKAVGAEQALTGNIAAISCGIVDGQPVLDLDYREDSRAEVDANVVMTGEGTLVEVQATAERTPL